MQNEKCKMQNEAEFTRSFKRAALDPELISMAEEGLEDYLRILDEKLTNSQDNDSEILTY
jgi:hypothetical protein